MKLFSIQLFYIFSQDISNNGELNMLLINYMSIISAIVGACFSLIEIISYMLLYSHIYKHDNSIAATILDPSIIRMRNRTNSISLYGHVLSWIMKVWYILLVGFVSNLFNQTSLREVPPFFKTLEFFLVPFVQIRTSAPIKQFLFSKRKQ